MATLSSIITPTNITTASNTQTLTNKTITGGILNGTLGATTPSTVAATTVSATQTLTISPSTGVQPCNIYMDNYYYANLISNAATSGICGLSLQSKTSGGVQKNSYVQAYAGDLNLLVDSTNRIVMPLAGGVNVTGKLTSSGGLVLTGGGYVSGEVSLYSEATNGLVLIDKSGSNNDFLLASYGAASIMRVPAGTVNVVFSGSVSKASGTFRIEHPLPSKSATHNLVHSFIEGPKCDLIYRGKVDLVDGKASVNIDTVATMTEGTFEALCRDVQCFTSNESGWGAIRGKVVGNILTIEAQDAASTDNVSWMVIGERKDKHIMDTDWTDKNGRPIVEPLKPVEPALEAK